MPFLFCLSCTFLLVGNTAVKSWQSRGSWRVCKHSKMKIFRNSILNFSAYCPFGSEFVERVAEQMRQTHLILLLH